MIVARVGDLMQRIENDRTGQILVGRTIGRSGDAMCDLHRAREDKKREFLGRASKLRSTVCQWFGLKTAGMVCQWFGIKITGTISPGLASKPVATISPGLISKPDASVSPSLTSKPVATGFPIWASTDGYSLVI
jgi:hypothetical protein